jgi:ankyrin repeat protein
MQSSFIRIFLLVIFVSSFVHGMQPQPEPPKQPMVDRLLLDAIDKGNVDGVKAALAAGADPNARATYGRTMLIDAIVNVNVPEDICLLIIDELIKAGADIALPDAGDKYPPIYYAIFYGRAEVLRKLLRCGAGIGHLYTAVSMGRTECVRELLMRGASLYPWPNYAEDENIQRLERVLDVNPLLLPAIRSGVNLLEGASAAYIQVNDSDIHETFVYAAGHGRFEVVTQLLKYDIPDSIIIKALECAAYGSHVESGLIVDVLLQIACQKKFLTIDDVQQLRAMVNGIINNCPRDASQPNVTDDRLIRYGIIRNLLNGAYEQLLLNQNNQNRSSFPLSGASVTPLLFYHGSRT